MNTKQTEALKLALEALEANQPVNYCMNNNGEKFPIMQEDPFRFERNTKAITAIREALAEQPAQRKPLTDEQIEAMSNDFEEGYVFLYRSFARAIEAAHDIKKKNA